MSYLTKPLTVLDFTQALTLLDPKYRSSKYLLAVSGGVDSMVLVHLCLSANVQFEVAHVNYHLRGEQSNEDQNLVESYCLENKIRFHGYSVNNHDAKPEGSIQLWARNLRYDFFKQVQEKSQCSALLTAHHLDDQLETFVINLSRGSGLKGLRGIPANENGILRPLLSFSKGQLYNFAENHGIKFREDASNLSDSYLRNRIRNHIVPELKQTNAHFLENFHKSMTILNSMHEDLKRHACDFLEQHSILNQDGTSRTLDLVALRAQSDSVRYQILDTLGFRSSEQMEAIFQSQSGSVFPLLNHIALVNRDQLIVSAIGSQKSTKCTEYQITDSNGTLEVPQELQVEFASYGQLHWSFDAHKLTFPLKIRHQKPGDLIFPIGMIGKKKISKFFKDEKISILAKSKIWILCDAQNQILGILPFRQDRRFLAQNHTEKVYSFRIDCEI